MLRRWTAWLAAASPPALPVIIERTSGLLVDRLLAAGHPVVPVHPPRSGRRVRAGEPRGPSRTLATPTSLPEDLRTDGHRPGLQELQALVRLREDHVQARTAASMKLGALQEAHWPGPKAVVYWLASPIALAFLAEYPTPGRRPARPGLHGQPAAAGTATAAASH